MSLCLQSSELLRLDGEIHPKEILRMGMKIAGGNIKIACSFSIENVVVIDLLKEELSDLSIFAIDTGRLNEETYEVADRIARRYGARIEWYFPEHEDVEKIERDKGLFSFRDNLENRRECCRIRKVEPLRRALEGAAAWITGMRRQQGITRKGLRPLEIDQVNGGLLKINPLTFWTQEDVWDYVNEYGLPFNTLYDKGYSSIGCAPCTRPVRKGESVRDGRWWWENAEHRECGLHQR